MMADGQVSVGRSLAYAWVLLRQHWRAIWSALAMMSLAATVNLAGAYAQNQTLMICGALAQLVALPMLYGAIYRLAFADRHPADPGFAIGHGGLQWRALEWRVLGAMALLMLFLLIIAILGLVLVCAVAFGIMINHGGAAPTTPQAVLAALGQDGQIVVSVVVTLVILVLIYLGVRLSLAFAATVDTGKISVLGSWPLTKANTWRILATFIVIQLPLTLLESLVLSVGDGGGVEAGSQMSAEAALLSALAIGVVYGCVIAPLSAGVLAYYYRNPSGPAPRDFPPDGS